ncbi:hypothetical protein Dimus_030794, partial [Dionaea muscipula]
PALLHHHHPSQPFFYPNQTIITLLPSPSTTSARRTTTTRRVRTITTGCRRLHNSHQPSPSPPREDTAAAVDCYSPAFTIIVHRLPLPFLSTPRRTTRPPTPSTAERDTTTLLLHHQG